MLQGRGDTGDGSGDITLKTAINRRRVGRVDLLIDWIICDPYGAGCEKGKEFGFGHIYRVTFMDVQVAEPSVSVTDVTFVGGSVDGSNGFGASNEVSNVREFDMDNRAYVARSGEFIEVEASSEGQENEWLTPFYVMLCDVPSSILSLQIARRDMHYLR